MNYRATPDCRTDRLFRCARAAAAGMGEPDSRRGGVAESRSRRRPLQAGEAGGLNAARCRRSRLAEADWARLSDAGESDSAGEDVDGAAEVNRMGEIVFEITQEADGAFTAEAIVESIFTQTDSWEGLRANAREAVQAFYVDSAPPA